MTKDQNFKTKIGKSEAGFLKLIVLIVVALIVLNFLEFNIEALWSNMILPVVSTIWDICVWFANVLYSLLKVAFSSIGLVVDIVNKIIGR
ncbi:hypothetical protein GW764_00475 [Candidatus Parcubacteria bacterium]|nr:hypothetical protein [Candidatus Parcubacteria bacterium]